MGLGADHYQRGFAMMSRIQPGSRWFLWLPSIFFALGLAITQPVPAEENRIYTGPLWDAHGHPWPLVTPPLSVVEYGVLYKELGVVGGYLTNIDIDIRGPVEGARVARRFFPSSVFPFVSIEFGEDNLAKWLRQDPVFIDEQLAKMEKALASGDAFGIGEVFTQFGEMGSIGGPTMPADASGMMKLARLAARYQVPFHVHHTVIPVGEEEKGARIADWENLLAGNPKTKILMAHAGFTPSWLSDPGPNGGPATFREWLEKFPNLYVELSWAANGPYLQRGLTETTIPFDPNAIAPITEDGKTLRPAWKKLLEDYADRFIGWGSDPTFNWDVDGKRAVKTQAELVEVIMLGVENTREILGQLSPRTALMIGYKNGYYLLAP